MIKCYRAIYRGFEYEIWANWADASSPVLDGNANTLGQVGDFLHSPEAAMRAYLEKYEDANNPRVAAEIDGDIERMV